MTDHLIYLFPLLVTDIQEILNGLIIALAYEYATIPTAGSTELLHAREVLPLRNIEVRNARALNYDGVYLAALGVVIEAQDLVLYELVLHPADVLIRRLGSVKTLKYVPTQL
jgi:hypothetical protein